MEAEEQRADETATDTAETATDESPEQFAESIESDPAYNPTDEELKREKGG